MQNKIIETPRTYLELLSEKHKNDLYNLLSNLKINKYISNALNKEESEYFYRKIQKKYDQDGFSFFALIKKDDCKFLGIAGILKQIIDNIEEYEVSYRILDKYWGKGYGTETAKGCLSYGMEVLKKESIIALIREENLQSINVAEKNKMIYEREVIFHDLPHRLYRKWKLS